MYISLRIASKPGSIRIAYTRLSKSEHVPMRNRHISNLGKGTATHKDSISTLKSTVMSHYIYTLLTPQIPPPGPHSTSLNTPPPPNTV
jgi:hypothetical protein